MDPQEKRQVHRHRKLGSLAETTQLGIVEGGHLAVRIHQQLLTGEFGGLGCSEPGKGIDNGSAVLHDLQAVVTPQLADFFHQFYDTDETAAGVPGR